jgi:hypothetical protein
LNWLGEGLKSRRSHCSTPTVNVFAWLNNLNTHTPRDYRYKLNYLDLKTTKGYVRRYGGLLGCIGVRVRFEDENVLFMGEGEDGIGVSGEIWSGHRVG